MAERFDALAAFAALPPERQRSIGEAGLLLAYAILGKEWFGDRSAPVFETAESEAFEILLDRVSLALRAFDRLPPALPDLNPFGVAQCRRCGCTERHACPGGCAWATPDLCTRCAARLV